jgi:hypothetical protein
MDENFIVDTDEKAEWCLNKIREEQQERDRLTDLCNKMINKYSEQIKELEQDFETKTSYFKGQLQQYFNTVKRKATKTQETYKLISGTLKIKYKAHKVKKDDLKLLEYLENNNYTEYIETIKKAKWSELKETLKQVGNRYVDENGQIVEGIELEEQEPEFLVEIK